MERTTNDEKLKIGILTFYYPHLGGSGLITSKLAEHLAKQGHEIHVIGYDSSYNPPHMRKAGVNLHNIQRVDYPCLQSEPYTISLASGLCNVDSKYGLDLVHANYAVPHATSAYLAREQRKSEGKDLPYVVTGHGSDIHTNGCKNSINPILQLSLNQADALTYVSDDLKQIAEKDLGIRTQGIVIPNFVDTDEFYPDESSLREKLNIPRNAFVISHVSNFAPIKQVSHFSRLASYLKGSGELSNIYFLMAGDGRDRSFLEDELSKLGVKDHFHFLGRLNQQDVLDVYNASNCVLLTSKHEGNPLTLLEAMACGVPVIGSKVGGIKETIDDCGLLFEPWDIGDLSEKVRVLKENDFLKKKLAEKALRKVNEKYSPDFIMNRYLEVFRGVLAHGKSKD